MKDFPRDCTIVINTIGSCHLHFVGTKVKAENSHDMRPVLPTFIRFSFQNI